MPRNASLYRLSWLLLLCVALPALLLYWGKQASTAGTSYAARPVVTVESLHQGLDLAGSWRFQPGDDPAWAAPGFDHSAWRRMPLPGRWERGGYPEGGQMAWYRLVLELPAETRDYLASGEHLALSVGKVMSAYELYVGGQLLGGAGELPPSGRAVYDQQRFYVLPASAVDRHGRIVVALRVWGGDEAAVNAWGGGPYAGSFTLGEYRSLILRGLVASLPGLLFCVLTLAFGAHHLLIYTRNPGLTAYLWFGLLALDISIYGLMLSQWKHLLPLPFIALKKMEFVAIYLFPALAIQMLWSLIDRPLSRPLRFYQLSFVGWALMVLAIPGAIIHFYTLPLWQLSVLPVFVFVPWVLTLELRAGNREARIILPAVVLFLATCFNDLLIDVVLDDGLRLMPLGFIGMLVGMSFSLVSRFTRMYNELEQEVAQRTEELQSANRQLVEVARIDPLTGVLNRRGFTEEVEAEIPRMARTGEVFSIVLADVDFFKRFNDEHGHLCGDNVLKQVAQILDGSTRDIDQIGRWGGEEFILLLPETEGRGAAVLAEKLRDTLETTAFQFNGECMNLTMTFGVSEFRGDDSLDSCLARADMALYHGKKNGRNRVMIGKCKGLSLVN